ncbi:MAG: preprotein translocase subunit YajC [Tractidigestivibacter sp.]|jgi:preprotein translocase subunit YajC|uniref:preprotein translocase subunit YajC n=1 Tax=Tractidigestivibacter sp. TaxID=2847320 RepID=UPI003D943F9A
MSSDFLQSVLASCVALLLLIAIMGVVYAIYSSVKARKKRDYFADLHKNLKSGQRVAFAGGLLGTLVRVGEETCDVKIKSGDVIEVSRYAIQEIEGK